MEVIPALVAGRYEVGALLGAGGSGRVHRARDVRLDRDVAVKLVPAEAARSADPAARERFASEARSAARTIHPNAVAIYDAGESDGHLYLVMELVDGPSLATVLAREGRLAVDRAVRIVEQVLAALEAAHAAGIVHRDVKPANVLLAPDGTAKLTDFGIAKRLDEVAASLTATGFVVGTPRYLAPEQLTGGSPSPATDVYACGVLLHEALTGHPPYDGATPIALALAQRAGPPPDVRALRPDVPAAVAAVVARALRADPAERQPTAASMRAELASGSDDTVVAATAAAAPTARVPRADAFAPPLASTSPSPSPRPPSPSAPSTVPAARPRRGWLVPAGFVAVLVAGLAALSFADDDDAGRDPGATDVAATTAAGAGATGAAPADTVAPTTPADPASAAVTAAPTPPVTPPVTEAAPSTAPATAPPAPIPGPGDIDGLVALVRAAPEAFGPRAGDLLEELVEVAGRNGERRRDAADELLERARDWAGEGELGADAAALVETVVAPLAEGGGGDDDRGRDDD